MNLALAVVVQHLQKKLRSSQDALIRFAVFYSLYWSQKCSTHVFLGAFLREMSMHFLGHSH